MIRYGSNGLLDGKLQWLFDKSARKLHIFLLIAIFLAHLWANYDLSPPNKDPLSLLAYSLGGIAFVLALPTIVWLIKCLIHRLDKPGLLAYCAIGGTIISVLVLSSKYSLQRYERQQVAVSFEYSFVGCDYTAKFPGPPTEKKLFAPGLGEYIQADFITKHEALRAECFRIHLTEPKVQVRMMMEQYAIADGFTAPVIEAKEGQFGALYDMRAYKTIDNIPTTYKFRVFYSKDSFLMLAVGGASKDYPPPIQDKFFGSVRLKVP